MDIEVNEYVRTKEGYLGILIAINKQDYNYLVVDTSIEVRRDGYPSTYLYLKKENIKKHRKQLIDLIEVGDYVNGYKVIKLKDGFVDGTMAIVLSDNVIIYRHHSEDIKTILTKEQYLANCYKVGGEDE